MTQAALDRVLEEIQRMDLRELRAVERAVQERMDRVGPDAAQSAVADGAAAADGATTVEDGMGDAWAVLAELTGSVSAPADWAEEHDHYLSGAPRRSKDAQA